MAHSGYHDVALSLYNNQCSNIHSVQDLFLGGLGLNDLSGLNDPTGLNDPSGLNDLSGLNDPSDPTGLMTDISYMDCIYDMIFNDCQPTRQVTTKMKAAKREPYPMECLIPAEFDTINSYYLEVSCKDGEPNINDLLAIRVTINNPIYSGTLLNTIFTQALHGYFIKRDDYGVMQIPIYNFDNFGVLGLPTSVFVVPGIMLSHCNKKYDYAIVTRGKLLSPELCRKVKSKTPHHICFEEHVQTVNYRNERILLSFSPAKISKYILIHIQEYQEYADSPVINGAILEFREDDGSNPVKLTFNYEDIVRIEMLGQTLYVLPLAREFSTLENMAETIKSRNLSPDGLNFRDIKHCYLTLDMLNCCDNTQIILTAVSLNIMTVSEFGMTGTVFCT
jgi:hypothetical protein